MSIRERLSENRGLAGGIAACFVIIILVIIVWELSGTGASFQSVSNFYYTTNDTATEQAAVDALFTASATKIPPFDHNGKPADLAMLYTDANGTKWVAYLQRFSPEGVKAATTAAANVKGSGWKADTQRRTAIAMSTGNQVEVKRPGPGPWVSASSKAGEQVMKITPPKGYKPPVDHVTP